MACMAAIIPVVLNSAGVVVDQGREIRLANRAQRRSLRTMYDTCAMPACSVRSKHCEPHHITWWRRSGTTDLHQPCPVVLQPSSQRPRRRLDSRDRCGPNPHDHVSRWPHTNHRPTGHSEGRRVTAVDSRQSTRMSRFVLKWGGDPGVAPCCLMSNPSPRLSRLDRPVQPVGSWRC